MLSSINDGSLEAALNNDLAVLHTLAHVGWLTTQQVQALCFPGYTIATVRLRLRYLQEAHWIEHVRWRVSPSGGGHIWSITRQGVGIAERYLPVPVPTLISDLGRPTTALEQNEWRIRLAIRNLVVRLILAARRLALLSSLELTLPPYAWPPELAVPTMQPDVELAINWHPPTVKTDTWLPWSDLPSGADQTTHYVIYVERSTGLSHATWLPKACTARTEQEAQIPVVVLQQADRYEHIQEQLCSHDVDSIRLSTWPSLEAGLLEGAWHTRDACAERASNS